MKKIILFLLLLVAPVTCTFSAIYYVATDGSDLNAGTISQPFATIQRGQAEASPGDTVYIRGGNYLMTESQIAKYNGIWAYVIYLDKSGTSGKRINYWAYPGEKPVFNLSNVKPVNCRVHVFQVNGSYIHLKGLEVVGTQVTILLHTQSECFDNQGSNNIYEKLKMHDGQAIGFYLTRGSNNLVLNCDAYNNYDKTSEGGAGGNTDGFGGHPSKGSVGNVFRGCRAWFNSDDGYDCISASESILFENCWAFYNGFSTAFKSLGDGNGFKVGGHGAAPTSIANMPNPVMPHTTRFCLAYRNKSNGFYANHQIITGNYWYNNTAYRNGTNYNMLSQDIVKDAVTGADITKDVPGINHVLHNNLSFRYGTQTETANMGTSINTYNSFSPNSGVVVSSDDFLSIDEALLIAPRQEGGELPEVNFLRLKSTSDLIDKGMNVGFGFGGSAPDLGAFELKQSQSISFDSLGVRALGSPAFKPKVSSTSGLAVTLSSSNTSVAILISGYLSLRGVGTTTITATQPGNDYFYPALSVSRDLTVEAANALMLERLDGVVVYPIPVSDFLNVEMPVGSGCVSLRLFNCDGKMLSEGTVVNGLNRMDMSSYPSGVYYIQLKSERSFIVRKILKK